MRTILVTGGAGFIGSAVVREIIQHTADRVVVVDKLTYAGNLMSLAPVAQDARFAFEQVDICDRAELDRIFRQHQPDTVMHWQRKAMSIVRLTARRRLSRPISWAPIRCWRRPVAGGIPRLRRKNRRFASITSPPMKCMAICTAAMISLPRPRPMRQAAPIRLRKPAATTGARGCEPMACRRLSPTAQITTARITFPRS